MALRLVSADVYSKGIGVVHLRRLSSTCTGQASITVLACSCSAL